MEQAKSPIRSFLRGWRLWVLVILVAYTLAGFFLLPWIIQRQLTGFGEQRLERPLTVEKVRFNPYALSLSIEGLRLDEADGSPIAALQQFYVDFQASSLFRWAWTFKDLRLVEPYLNFVRFEDGGNNFQRLAETLSSTAEPTQESSRQEPGEGGLPRVLLMHFGLEAGAVDVADLTPETDFETHFESINLDLYSLSTLPDQDAQNSFRLVTENGAEIVWKGELQVNPFRLNGHLDAIGERPRLIWRYIQDDVDFEIADGQVTLALDLDVTGGDAGTRVAIDNIEYALEGLLLRPKGEEQDVLTVPKLAISGGRFRFPERTIHIEEARIDGARLVALRDEEGVLNIVDLLEAGDPAATGAPNSARPEEEVRTPETATPSASPAPPASASVPASEEEASGKTQDTDSVEEPATVAAENQSAEASTPDAGTTGEEPGPGDWQFSLSRFIVQDFGAEFEDRSFSRPVKSGLENLNLDVQNFSIDPGSSFGLRLETAVATGGSVSAEGDIGLEPRKADLSIDVDGLSLDPLEPLIGDFARLRLLSGTLSVDGAVSHSPEETLKFSGAATVDELVTEDTILDERFVAWKRLSMPSVEFALDGNTLLIDVVDFQAPYAKLTVKPDGTTNINDVFPADDGGEAGAADSGVTPVGDTPADGPMKIDINRVTLEEGSANFADMSLPLPFATAIHSMKGEVGDISSYAGKPATVAVAGVVDESGSAKIDGELDPFAPVEFLKMDVIFKNVHMPRLTPYSAKFAGREIESGKLSLDLKYRIEQGKLDSRNNVVIDRIVLGDKVESPGAANLPLDLAVALLQDSDGRIDLDLPVSGDLNNPEFHYGSVVWKAFSGILVKVVTAPFKLLGALIPGGGEGEQLEFINFGPGSAALSEAETEELNTIAEVLTKRPRLLLKVPSSYSATTDKEALQAARVREQVDARLSEIKEGGDADRERIALEQIYVEEFSETELDNLKAANTRAAEGGDGKPELDEEAYEASLTRSLRNHEVVTTAELESLATQRAKSITDYLVTEAGVAPGRLSTSEITTVEPDAEGRIPLQFEVDTNGGSQAAGDGQRQAAPATAEQPAG